jgi:hypothetical protein
MEAAMALDDRDAKFEKALARHLHDTAQREACPDPETLAAYHERTLSPAELNSWKQHIAGCARCQELLAHLEITEEIPLDIDQREPAAALVAAAQRNSSGARAAARQSATVQAINAKKVASAPPPRIALRWVVPAGAIAAGLLLWVTVQQRSRQENGATPPVQIAQNRPEPPVVREKSAQPPPRNEERRDLQTSTLAAGSKKANPSNSVLSDKMAAAPGIPSAVGDRERAKSQGAYFYKPQAKEQAAAHLEVLDKNAQEATRQELPMDSIQNEKKLEMAPAPAAPPPQPSQLSGGALDKGAAAAPEMVAKQKAARANVATSSEAVEVSSGSKGATALRLEAVQNARIILAPNGKSLWRVGPGGAIEYSSSAGGKWAPQQSGVAADLVAGSAPSKKTCWIVGRSGTILLTTDGGAIWKQLAPPITDDLGGIQAFDALHATVWDVPNAHRYETSDAGVTWRSIPSE